MSLFSRFRSVWRRGDSKRAEALPSAEAPPFRGPPPPEAVERSSQVGDTLSRLGEDGGPSETEAIDALRAARGTIDEAHAVEALLRKRRDGALPESLTTILATTLVDRGQLDTARLVLHDCKEPAAKMLQADLAERAGDLDAARLAVEHVLVHDIDYPGALERYRRWRPASKETRTARAGATLLLRRTDAPFELVREVGRGGAGVVYEAVDTTLGRRVAFKLIHHPERARAALLHEGRVTAQLSGPGIVRVFDIDPFRGWLALEWAAHGSLRERVRGTTPLPLEAWALAVAQALARIHRAGWVHLDVKPANVLLTEDQGAKLTDFGIARRIGEPSPPGSAGYTSIERGRGRPTDPRDDIYGFGRVLEETLDAWELGPRTRALRDLVERCLGPDTERPADGAELVRLLEPLTR